MQITFFNQVMEITNILIAIIQVRVHIQHYQNVSSFGVQEPFFVALLHFVVKQLINGA